MANNVGALTVELAASTAKFDSDLGEAVKIANQKSRDIQKALAAETKYARDRYFAFKMNDEFDKKAADNAKKLADKAVSDNARAMAKIRADADASDRETKARFKSYGTSFLGAFGITLGIGLVVDALNEIKDKTIEGERALNQLNAVLVATKNAAGIGATGLDDLAKSVEKASVFDDDDIRRAETALLRFRGIQTGVFQDAIKLAPDVAAALGVELPQAAVALGRALSDPATGMRALRAAGVHLSEQQIDLVARMKEAGDSAGAQRLVLEEVAKSVGGTSEADNTGLYGATKRLSRSWGDLEKAVGRKIFGGDNTLPKLITERFEHLTEVVNNSGSAFSEWVQKVERLAQAIGKIPLVKAAIGGISFDKSEPQEQPARRSVSGKITNLVTGESIQQEAEREAALRGLIDAKVADEQERIYQLTKTALKKRAESAETFYAFELATQKQAIDLEQSQLEYGYARGQVSTEDYYARLEKIADQSYLAQSVNLGKRAKAAEDFKNSLGATPEEQESQRIKIIGLAGQTDAAYYESQKKVLAITQQRAQAIERLNDDYADLAIKLREANNDTVGAGLASFDLANKYDKRRDIAEAFAGNQAALGALRDREALRDITENQLKLTQATKDYGIQLDKLSLAQERIDIAVSSGQMGELQGLDALSKANQSYIGILQLEIDKLRERAALSKKPEDQIAVERAEVALARLGTQTDLVGDKFRKIFHDDFADGLTDVINGTKSLGEAFRSMTNNIVQQINRIAANNIADAIMGKGSGGDQGMIGGIFGDFFKKLFSGGSLFSDSAGGGFNFNVSDAFAGYAGGTSFARGGLSLVGERGPELVNLPRGSQVTPNHMLKAGRTQNVTINVYVPEGTSAESSQQIALQTIGEYQRVGRRKG